MHVQVRIRFRLVFVFVFFLILGSIESPSIPRWRRKKICGRSLQNVIFCASGYEAREAIETLPPKQTLTETRKEEPFSCILRL